MSARSSWGVEGTWTPFHEVVNLTSRELGDRFPCLDVAVCATTTSVRQTLRRGPAAIAGCRVSGFRLRQPTGPRSR